MDERLVAAMKGAEADLAQAQARYWAGLPCEVCGEPKQTGPDEDGLWTFHGHTPDVGAVRVHVVRP